METVFVRSTLCDTNACTAVAVTADAVLVRNSDQPDTVASFSHEAWSDFLAAVRRGEHAGE